MFTHQTRGWVYLLLETPMFEKNDGFPIIFQQLQLPAGSISSISAASKVEEPWLNMAVLRYPANKYTYIYIINYN
jgi:hypothetical protein